MTSPKCRPPSLTTMLNCKASNYTATTGRLPITMDERPKPKCFSSPTRWTEDSSKRPLTFAFNGGPGAATVRLHMGAPAETCACSPYHIADNPYTLLDKSDIVFADAIGTGFSRAANA